MAAAGGVDETDRSTDERSSGSLATVSVRPEPDSTPALRSDLDRLLELAAEFDARAAGRGSAPTGPPLVGPPPAPPPRRGRSVAIGALVAAVAVALAAVVLMAAMLGDDGAGTPGDLGPAVSAERSTASPVTDAAPTPPPSVAPAGDPVPCDEAGLLAAVQLFDPVTPRALSTFQCAEGYALVGVTGAPDLPPDQPVPPTWVALRWTEGGWLYLAGGPISDTSWVDTCLQVATSDPRFPTGLCN